MIKFIFSSIILFYSITIFAEELYNADIYLQGTNKGVLLFRLKNNIIKKKNTTFLSHIYTTVDGKIATKEVVTFKENKLYAYYVEMSGGNCGCRLTRSGNKLIFNFTKGNNNKKRAVKYSDDIVMGPTLTDYVHKNWGKIIKGKKVTFLLPAMSLQRLAQFNLQKLSKSRYSRKGVIVVRMKISNFILRAFVDPVDLVYNLKTKRLVEIHGKSLLERKVNGKIENPIVDIYYNYK